MERWSNDTPILQYSNTPTKLMATTISKRSSNSETKLIALLGYPVRHSVSPQFQNVALETLGINTKYLAFEVPPDKIKIAFKGLCTLGAIGANITVPYKETIYKMCSKCSPEARVIEAVNTVKFEDGKAIGFNTDAYGITAALKESRQKFKAAKVVVLGGGGAARAAVTQAVFDGAKEICVLNRTVSKAKTLVKNISAKVELLPKKEKPKSLPKFTVGGYKIIEKALKDASVLINASSVGLKKDDPHLFDYKIIKPSTFVYDMVYNPPMTPLLLEAKRRGCKTANGITMLLHQGAKAFEIWFNRPAPVELMRNRLLHPNIFAGSK